MDKLKAKRFSELDAADLVEAAKYFGTLEEGNKKLLEADLVENGVTWEQYHERFVAPVLAEQQAEENAKNVITSPDVTGVPKEDTVTVVKEEVVVADPAAALAQANYLIKMERKNPYFEFGKYKFTHENPYAIMPADDAQRILSTEEGFRQAYPAELQEYYS